MNARDRVILILWSMIWAAAAVLVRYWSEALLEGGDSIQHYQIARHSWQHPDLFLHHWGKPLFTLFASPFAQLGHWGVSLFNAVCLLITAWAADGLLKRAGPAARWLYVPALLLVPVYGTLVFAGMTEVLFGLLTALVIRALHDERPVLAMIIVSFMPFSRPEYILFAPFAVGWVMMKGQWRSLPILLVGHVIYGVIGLFAFGDALWAFHNDPYTWSNPIYGSGPLLHFASQALEIYGVPLSFGLLLAPVAGGWLWKRKESDRPLLRLLFFVGVLPTVAIWSVHSILWWKGWKGSLGLVRVIATTAPLVVMCMLIPIVRASGLIIKEGMGRTILAVMAAAGYILLALWSFLSVQPLPVKPWPYDRFVRTVGDHVAAIKGDYGRVVYFHPTLGYYAGLDPYDSATARQCWGLDTTLTDLGLLPNDLVVWDAHFAPNEGHTPLSMLLDRTDLELVELLVPEERMEVLGGHLFEVYLFARREGKRTEERQVLFDPDKGFQVEVVHRSDEMPCPPGVGGRCFQGTEFPLDVSDIPIDAPGLLYAQMTVSGELFLDGEDQQAELVFVEENASGKLSYWSEKLLNGKFSHHYRIPPRAPDVRNKLYIWNRSGKGLRVVDLRMELVRVMGSRKEEQQQILDPGQGFLVELLHRMDTLPCPTRVEGHCFQGGEFPMELLDLPLGSKDMYYAELVVSGEAFLEGNGDATELVFTEESAEGRLSYWSEKLANGTFEHRFRVPPRAADVRNKLYLWNRSGQPFRMNDLRLSVVRTLRK